MKIEIWYGLPYNRWEILGIIGGLNLPRNPFENFRITKGDFCFQLLTLQSGEVDIKIKLPYQIEISL